MILKNKIVTTKKNHNCFGCVRKFPAGTRMEYWAGIYEGDFNSGYICDTCREVLNLWREDEYNEGFVLDDLSKNQTPEQYLEELKIKIKNPSPDT